MVLFVVPLRLDEYLPMKHLHGLNKGLSPYHDDRALAYRTDPGRVYRLIIMVKDKVHTYY